MRISTDPQDPAFIDARPRRVWVNDVEVHGWTVADEFRRCAITSAGVVNGSVLIERLSDDAPEVVPAPVESSNNLCGMFVAESKVTPAAPAPAPSFAPVAVPVAVKPAAKVVQAKKSKGKR